MTQVLCGKATVDAIATAGMRLEATFAPDSMLLDGFSRKLQFDAYSCGAKVAFAVLSYYGKARSFKNVMRNLGTTSEGTDSRQLRRLFARRGLRPVTLKAPTIRLLKKEIDRGHPLIVSMDDETHWAVICGYGARCLFVADPSPKRMRCRQSTANFRKRWDKWALAVRPA